MTARPAPLCPVLVGRDAELGVLRSALAEAENGRGAVVVLAGDAGIGKSRLLREVLDAAERQGNAVGVGRSLRSASTTAFRPLAEALLQIVRVQGRCEDDRSRRARALLYAVLPIAEEVASPTPATAGGLELERGEAVLRLLRTLAEPAPLVVALDDVQWADPDTVNVLEHLADNLHRERVLCVVTVRSEPRSPAYERLQALRTRGSLVMLTLAPLQRSDAGTMVLACRPGARAAEVDRVVSAADGVPFLVEELLAAPGIPETFAASVAVRLAHLGSVQRQVVEVAAVLGREFDWGLLADAAGVGASDVASALEHGVDQLLLAHAGGAYRFRHTLTREAVLDQVFPHVRVRLAGRALEVVEEAHPGLPHRWRGVAAELALQAGDCEAAARLLIEAGRESLGAAALATAVESLTRASALAAETSVRQAAQELLVQALASAGRADACMDVGRELLASPSLSPLERAAVHLWLAQAAVEATWWSEAGRHLASAGHLLAQAPDRALAARHGVLAAETALAMGDLDEARLLVRSVIDSGDAAPEVRCHAFALLGRAERMHGLEPARAAFEECRACAEAHDLDLWRLRALHELGTIDLFDHAGSRRLEQARDAAEDLGAVSVVAVLDVQLAAASLFRFEPEAAIRHASSALAAADRLQLAQLRATALVFMAENHGLLRDPAAMERYNLLALAAAPGDLEIAGSVWGGRGAAALLVDDRIGAVRGLRRAVEILAHVPGAGPALYLGLWPLLLAVRGDADAGSAISAARDGGVTVNRANRGLLLTAEAVIAGRDRSQKAGAEDLLERARTHLAHYPVWSELALLLAAEAALADGWGDPRSWLTGAGEAFERHGLEPLARRARDLRSVPAPSRLAGMGVTARETEVLDLVRLGLSNRDIASRLTLSPRTVEKHVESLLRKTGARSRTHLVAATDDSARADPAIT